MNTRRLWQAPTALEIGIAVYKNKMIGTYARRQTRTVEAFVSERASLTVR